jgi:hypothetical protein
MSPPSPVLRFVVLYHDGIAEPHFDLMFEIEAGGELATWRSPRWPIDQETILTPLQPHRAAYLQFEGELSRHRGRVRRVAAGTYRRAGEETIQFVEPHDLAPIKIEADRSGIWRAVLASSDPALGQ